MNVFFLLQDQLFTCGFTSKQWKHGKMSKLDLLYTKYSLLLYSLYAKGVSQIPVIWNPDKLLKQHHFQLHSAVHLRVCTGIWFQYRQTCLLRVLSLSSGWFSSSGLWTLDQLDPHCLEGRWALRAGSLSDPAHPGFFKLRDSASIHFSNASVTSNICYTISVHVGGKCHYQTLSIALEGSTFSFDVRDQVNITVTFLHTSCPDCVVMRFDNKSKTTVRLLLFSRRREVESKELEEFRNQVECLNTLPPAVMHPARELCWEQSIQTWDTLHFSLYLVTTC